MLKLYAFIVSKSVFMCLHIRLIWLLCKINRLNTVLWCPSTISTSFLGLRYCFRDELHTPLTSKSTARLIFSWVTSSVFYLPTLHPPSLLLPSPPWNKRCLVLQEWPMIQAQWGRSKALNHGFLPLCSLQLLMVTILYFYSNLYPIWKW